MNSTHKGYRFPVIGTLETCFPEKNGTPRQSGIASASRARLRIDAAELNNPEYSLRDLSSFSHVWILFVFHLDGQAKACNQGRSVVVKSKVAPPRLGGAKVGLFATRSPHRPSPIGLSLVRILEVEGESVLLEGGDFVDGTPVLDMKPYLPAFDAPSAEGETAASVFVPDWASPTAVKEGDLTVMLTARAKLQLDRCFAGARPKGALIQTQESMLRLVGEVLSGDPRSVYRRDKCSDRLYFVELDGLHFSVWFDEEDGQLFAEVLRVRQN